MVSKEVKPTIENSGTVLTVMQDDISSNIYFSPCKKNIINYIRPLTDIVKIDIFQNITQYNFSYLDFSLVIKLINSRSGKEIKKIKKETNGADNVKGAINRYLKGLNGHNETDEEYKLLDTDLPNNSYYLIYECYLKYSGTGGNDGTWSFKLIYPISVTSVTKPLPKWNAWTVCERLLNIVEPLRDGEQPRFKLDQNQKQWLESIETPELQFTQSNLRECLQSVGSYIHAEPRLIKQGNEYIITFNKYGSGKYSDFTDEYKQYASVSNSIGIENYATNLDSSIDNLVNSIDDTNNGSIVEPFLNGYKSVLAEGSYVRITDETMYIATSYPIREVKSLKCFYNDKSVDITPYVFEHNEYNQLSSHNHEYPYSRSYAIYYTIGKKGIYGLNFKREELLKDWNNYTIINIIKELGINIDFVGDKNDVEYFQLSFQIEYIPIYSARVQQNKTIISAGKKWTKPYNQGQNQIEVQYYGEHLKGVIARLGNIDKSITYVIPNFPTVYPKVGELFDNNYYISTVATEIYTFYTKLTLALSQNFNRYSEYIGVNSVKRMYEVSEQQAFESEVSYREFVVFGNNVTSSQSIMLKDGIGQVRKIFNTSTSSEKISGAIVCGITETEGYRDKAILPVIISSLGNASVLTFKFEDNYSAGTYSEYVDIKEFDTPVIKGAYTQTLPYADNYGRLKYLAIDFINNITTNNDKDKWLYPPNNNLEWANGTSVISTGEKPLVLEKGNTEIISFNYQLEFVTNRQDIIIGSELPKNLSFIRNQNPNIRLILYKDKLNKFSNDFDTQKTLITEAHGYQIFSENNNYFNQFKISSEVYPALKDNYYKSWAWVALENGKYKLLLGKNMNIVKDENIFEGLYFNVVSEKDLYKEN